MCRIASPQLVAPTGVGGNARLKLFGLGRDPVCGESAGAEFAAQPVNGIVRIALPAFREQARLYFRAAAIALHVDFLFLGRGHTGPTGDGMIGELALALWIGGIACFVIGAR